jgi:hypothetical protein
MFLSFSAKKRVSLESFGTKSDKSSTKRLKEHVKA